MSAFKRIKKSDIVVLPYVANKYWEFISSNLSASGISIFNGAPGTGQFNPSTDDITNGQYDRLVYDSINHMFYQEFSGSFLSNNDVLSSNNYVSSSIYRPSGSYYQYGNVNNIIKAFPTGSNASIKVLSIPKSLYSSRIHPGTLNISSSFMNLVDDGYNNVYDVISGSVFVGNIFYDHGIVVITSPSYQSIVALPPIARNNSFSYYSTAAYPQYLNILSNDSPRTGTIMTGSVYLFGGDSSKFVVNLDGTINLNNTYNSIPGTYSAYYSVSSSVTASIGNPVMQSNTASISVTVIPPFVYANATTSSIFQTSGCSAGGTGSFVTYTVPFGTFTSSVSQAAADSLASASIAANGQIYANANGYCTYYNSIVSGSFTKNSCGNGGVGSTVIYTISSSMITSSISQADATMKASASVASYGQIYANSIGYCTYYNTVQSGSYNRSNCGSYFTGSWVTYTASANIFSSSISLDDANNQAISYININGPVYANTNGTCTTATTVNVNWLNFQIQGATYIDSNLIIYKYSPASNPTPTTVVNHGDISSGSFLALVGDRIVSQASNVDPWPTTGTSSLYLDVIGQSGSSQVTHVSGSVLTSDIVLGNLNPVYVEAYSGYNQYTPGSTNLVSGSFCTNGNSLKVSLNSNALSSSILQFSGKWSTGITSGSWRMSYALTSGSSTFAPGIATDTLTNVLLDTYQNIISVDGASPYIQFPIGDLSTLYKLYNTGNCALTYYNNIQSGSFTRNNCGVGNTGSAVIYTVSASIFSSSISQNDANNQAVIYVNNNGQAYANSVGTCNINSSIVQNSGTKSVSGIVRKNSTNFTTFSYTSSGIPAYVSLGGVSFITTDTLTLYVSGAFPVNIGSTHLFPNGLSTPITGVISNNNTGTVTITFTDPTGNWGGAGTMTWFNLYLTAY